MDITKSRSYCCNLSFSHRWNCIRRIKDHYVHSFIQRKGGNTVYVAGKDDSGNTLGKWDDLRAVYKNEDGDIVNLTLSYNLSDDENRTPTESRTIDGITVNFNYDEYLILPDENEPLEASVQERKENDDHFFVSYGGEKETYFFSNASFIKDGVRYLIFTNDDVSADDLFKMAAELINR